MVEYSKFLFEQCLKDKTCYQTWHPWSKNCLSVNTLKNFLIGGFKFNALYYGLKLITSGKEKNNTDLKNLLMGFVASGVFSGLGCYCSVIFSCMFRRIFGKYYYYTFAYAPGFLSGLINIFLNPPNRRYILNDVFINIVFEYWINKLESKNYIKMTHFKQIIMFMFGSAYLSYLLRQEQKKSKKISIFWFFTPTNFNKKQMNNVEYIQDDSKKHSYCPHEGICIKYISKGTIQMFTIGCAMSLLKTIIPRLGSPMKAINSITFRHFKLGIFLGGYIGIYRLVSCLLCQHYKKDSIKYALPAGFLAGSAMCFKPNLTISLSSITGILHILFSRLYDYKKLPEKIPLPELLFGLCSAVIVDANMLHSDTCPNAALKMTSLISNYKFELVRDALSTILKNS